MASYHLSRGAYVLVSMVLLAGQYFSASSGLGLQAVAAIQLFKCIPTVFRLRALGRPLDDAMWTIVPGANFMLWLVCVRPTPSIEDRQLREARWRGQLTAFGAILRGLSLARQTWLVGVVGSLVFGVLGAVGLHWMVGHLISMQEVSQARLQGISQVLVGLTFVLGLYTGLQFLKRETASRVSWVPSLFLLPLLLVDSVLIFVPAMDEIARRDLSPLFLGLLGMSWDLVFSSIAGAAMVVAWNRAGIRAMEGRTLTLGEAFSEARRRTLEVSVPRGAKIHAVLVGMQVVIPGIFYALRFAFVDMIAVLDPEKNPLEESGRLTGAIQTRLFKLFTLFLAFGLVLHGGIIYFTAQGDPWSQIWAHLFDPLTISLGQEIAVHVVGALMFWVTQMALLAMYVERKALFRDGSAGEPPLTVSQ